MLQKDLPPEELPEMTARRVIIDTDPGLDDAVAILLAFASPELEVLGLTAVAGNVGLELTAANARRLCELAGRHNAKVFAGCARPLLRPQITAVVGVLRRRRPEVVLAPWREDRHPDHAVASELITRAVFLAGVQKFAPETGEPGVMIRATVLLGDLPHVIGARDLVPPVGLAPRAEHVQRWRAALAALGPAPYIGLTWRGGTDRRTESEFGAARDAELFKEADLRSIAAAARGLRATLVAIQRNPVAGEVATLAGMGIGLLAISALRFHKKIA